MQQGTEKGPGEKLEVRADLCSRLEEERTEPFLGKHPDVTQQTEQGEQPLAEDKHSARSQGIRPGLLLSWSEDSGAVTEPS